MMPAWKPMSAAWGAAVASPVMVTVVVVVVLGSGAGAPVPVGTTAAALPVVVVLDDDESAVLLVLGAAFPPDLGGNGASELARSMLSRANTPRAKLSTSTLSRLCCVCRSVISMAK